MSLAQTSEPRNRERGVVILWTAFFLILMLGFVALGIDVAKVMATRTQLQNAADAAALAGASGINVTTGVVNPDSAIARAQSIAAKNSAFMNGMEPVQVLAGDVTFPDTNEVKVVVRRDPSSGGSMVTHMAQVLGIQTIAVTATATAKAEPAGSITCGIVPLGAVPPNGETFHTGCTPGYKLKLPGGSGTNGNYGALDFPSCNNGPCAGMNPNGANTYRCLLKNGYCCELQQGDVLDPEHGNMSGPTSQAIDYRFDNDTDGREGICYSQYHGNNQRVVIVPVTTPFDHNNPVTINGFATFFLKNRPGNGNNSTIDGEFIFMTTPGSGGGSAGSTTFTIRLIK